MTRHADDRDSRSTRHESADEDAVPGEQYMKDCMGLTTGQPQAGLDLGNGQANPNSNAPPWTLNFAPRDGHHLNYSKSYKHGTNEWKPCPP